MVWLSLPAASSFFIGSHNQSCFRPKGHSMSTRKIILLSLALLIGGGIFLVFRSAEQAPPPAAQEVKVETTEILAAARDLPTGTILKDTDMKWISWAASADTSKLYVKGKNDSNELISAVLRDGLRAE